MSADADDGLTFSQAINQDDHGPYITIAFALGLTASFLFYLFRLHTRWPFYSLFKWDDAALTIATLLSLGQAIATSSAVAAGLGKRAQNLSESDLRHIIKSLYASNIIYILTMLFAKLACSLLIYRLTRAAGHIASAHIASVFIVLWGIATVAVFAATCTNFTAFSDSQHCYSETYPRWLGLVSVSVATEAALLFLPLYLVWNLHIPVKTKAIVVLAFWLRLPVPVLSVLRLLAIRNTLEGDIAFNYVPVEIFTQLEMHMCVVAATLPCMRPFLKALNTGYLGTTLGQVDPTGSSLKVAKSSKSTSRNRSHNRSHNHNSDNIQLGPLRPDASDTTVLIEHRRQSDHADEVTLGTSGSENIFVRRTVDVRVD